MVRQLRAETGDSRGTISRVSEQLGCGPESLRSWVRQDTRSTRASSRAPRPRRASASGRS